MIFDDCRISGNNLDGLGGSGGGMSLAHSEATLTDCMILNNSAPYYGLGVAFGGGISVGLDSLLNLTNCVVANNFSSDYGGGLSCGTNTSCYVQSCTFTDNWTDDDAGAVYAGPDSTLEMTDSILWGDAPNEALFETGSAISLTYCDIQGGYHGDGNIDADPLFVAGPNGDYCLSQTAAGQPADSPCINSGHDQASLVCFNITTGEICMDEMTTRSDEMLDTGVVDMGYHYSSSITIPAMGRFGFLVLLLLMGALISIYSHIQTR